MLALGDNFNAVTLPTYESLRMSLSRTRSKSLPPLPVANADMSEFVIPADYKKLKRTIGEGEGAHEIEEDFVFQRGAIIMFMTSRMKELLEGELLLHAKSFVQSMVHTV